MAIVEVVVYGDFDMPYTDSIWINESLQAFNVTMLETDIDHDRDGEKTKRELRRLGFKPLNTEKIVCGGAY